MRIRELNETSWLMKEKIRLICEREREREREREGSRGAVRCDTKARVEKIEKIQI
jgi:hypothetical protein